MTNSLSFTYQENVYNRMQEAEIIAGCKEGKRTAQKALYDTYSSRLFGVCKRCLKSHEDAEEVFSEGMYKILTKINMYTEKGSFYGWMKKVMVNQALMFLRKKKLQIDSLDDHSYALPSESSIIDDLYEADLRTLMDKLPMGYRTVMNMYLVEGYKHREIAEELGISINTSKSQLILAKKKLIKILKDLKHPKG